MINKDLMLILALQHAKVLLILDYNGMDNVFVKMILIQSKNMVQVNVAID